MTKLSGKITMAELRCFYPALAQFAEGSLRNPLDPDEACWLDGPAFARWLHNNGLDPWSRLGEDTARMVRRWREGDAVNLGSADSILVALGHHLNDVPSECWRDRPPKGAQRVPALVKDGAIKDFKKGVPPSAIAERYGVSSRAVRKWVEPYREDLKDAA